MVPFYGSGIDGRLFRDASNTPTNIGSSRACNDRGSELNSVHPDGGTWISYTCCCWYLYDEDDEVGLIKMHIHNEDCLNGMKEIPENTIDAIVTDPPYGLKFMGKEWDHGIPGIPFWQEALRVSKPGAHMLAFGGTRTHHRLMVAIEDAGWEIRDTLMWVYGSGFPKSLDVSKAIDKRGGNAHLISEIGFAINESRIKHGVSISEADTKYCGGTTLWSWYEGRPAGQQIPTPDIFTHISNDWVELKQYADMVAAVDRDIVGKNTTTKLAVAPGQNNDRGAIELDITTGKTTAAKQWNGWGTALKPAYEIIILARKPLEGTVANNVQKWGVGGINIDGCRVQTIDNTGRPQGSDIRGGSFVGSVKKSTLVTETNTLGRFPANLIHDGSDEVLELFPESKTSVCKPVNCNTDGSTSFDCMRGNRPERGYNESGTAARFFYCAKASKSERNLGLPEGTTNKHPTVKPLSLIEYLIKLISVGDSIVLDPFMGSGTTGIACFRLGRKFVGYELDNESFITAKARLENV